MKYNSFTAAAKALNYRLKLRRSVYPFKRHQIKNDYLFIHIPKTAGTALLTALGDIDRRRIHVPYFVYSNASRHYYNTFYKFAIVRNPWDRLVSTYTYLKNGGNGCQDMYFKALFEKNNVTFETFVMDYLTHQTTHIHNMFKPQTSFIYNEQDNLMVDFLGYQENLNEAFTEIRQHVNTKNKLSLINSSERTHYKDYYRTSEMVEKVRELYLRDVELLGYKF